LCNAGKRVAAWGGPGVRRGSFPHHTPAGATRAPGSTTQSPDDRCSTTSTEEKRREAHCEPPNHRQNSLSLGHAGRQPRARGNAGPKARPKRGREGLLHPRVRGVVRGPGVRWVRHRRRAPQNRKGARAAARKRPREGLRQAYRGRFGGPLPQKCFHRRETKNDRVAFQGRGRAGRNHEPRSGAGRASRRPLRGAGEPR